MKRITLALLMLFTITTVAQSNSINYKALIKDANNAVVANTQVTVQFQILQSVAQTNVYQETHTPTTDANGIIIINIGEGVVNSGVYANIDWSSDDHFLNTQINSGSGLTDMGTTDFNAVPYALSAKTVENITETDPKVTSTATNTVPKWDGTSLVDGSINDVDGDIAIGTATPDPSAKLDVSSTSKGFLPPRMSEADRDAITAPVAGLIVWCTNCGDNGEVQVYNGIEWTNIIGGAASVYTPVPGDTYQGGIVAYIFQSGDPGYAVGETHGLIVHSIDVSTNTQWGPNTFVPGTATGIGTGQSNTATIIAAQGAVAPYAAQACDNLTVGIYSDWFLPSKDELFEVYKNVHRFGCGADAPFNYTVCPTKLGNFNNATDANYWSSSCFTNPDSDEYGWRLNFYFNYSAVMPQTFSPVHVLATRYF